MVTKLYLKPNCLPTYVTVVTVVREVTVVTVVTVVTKQLFTPNPFFHQKTFSPKKHFPPKIFFHQKTCFHFLHFMNMNMNSKEKDVPGQNN